MTMDYRRNRETDCVAQARLLLAAAARGVNQLEAAANHAFCRLAALRGMLARLEKLAGSGEPYAAEAAALDAATVCREARALLRTLAAPGTRGAGIMTVVGTAATRGSAN
jgi:hypothetical protein